MKLRALTNISTALGVIGEGEAFESEGEQATRLLASGAAELATKKAETKKADEVETSEPESKPEESKQDETQPAPPDGGVPPEPPTSPEIPQPKKGKKKHGDQPS